MDILKLFINYWDEIIIVLLVAVGVGLFIFKNWQKFTSMSTEEKIAYIKRLLTNLSPIALKLVTDAEVLFGSGTGKLKRSLVLDALYTRIPDEYKKYVTEENLDAILEAALAEAKLLWEQNENVKKLMTGGKS